MLIDHAISDLSRGLVLMLPSYFALSAGAIAGACSTTEDCFLNGDCVAGACKCDAACAPIARAIDAPHCRTEQNITRMLLSFAEIVANSCMHWTNFKKRCCFC